jgi:hypothetical protein
LLVKRLFFLLNAAFAMAILDLISQVHLPSCQQATHVISKKIACVWGVGCVFALHGDRETQ